MPTNNIELIKALDKIRLGNLYVHNDELPDINFSSESLKTRKVYLVETLASINALVDRGTMLLYGGHGGGKTTLAKYLGQVFHQLSKDSIENCILRGHPQLTEEKILGSLDIAQLTGAKELSENASGEKKVDVIWNDFVDSQWKIIDEINRLSPYAQNILLSLLAESSVKYHNEPKRLGNFTLFATMNPKDDTNSNWDMSLPFKDRFAVALPITMPDYESLSTIGREKDKSNKLDNLASYLDNFDLRKAQEEVRELKYSEEAELLINIIISSYRICDRISKESNDKITVENGLCTKPSECHYYQVNKVCNKIINPLSVRVKEDLYRYGKALAWFLGDSEVELKHIKALAPFMIWHRSSLSKIFKKEISESRFDAGVFSLNIELESTREIIEMICSEFEGLFPLLQTFEKVKMGKLTTAEFKEFTQRIKDDRNNFLVTKKEIIPILEQSYLPVYNEITTFNNRIERTNDIQELNKIKYELTDRYDIPNRQFLADIIEKKRRKIGSQSLPPHVFKLSFKDLNLIVAKECFELEQIIKSKFNSNFNPTYNKTEVLSDLGEGEFNLSMERLNEGSGESSLRFVFQGKEDHPIFIFLKKHNVG
ncbi:AAA family ATPase [Shivajiella indica]|uniref:AAA family ATPase n=1 Tax=Shivajiella indica TaxID=872115 RepID=A0ABW5B9I6_9BACT